MIVVALGGGIMGAQIAVEYALGGHEVRVVARDLQAASARIEAAYAMLIMYRLVSEETVGRVRANLLLSTDALAGTTADIIVESLPEDTGLKVALLTPIASKWPKTIIATNTSSLSVTEIGRAIDASDRTVGTHYWNPPLLMPLVEVIAAGAERSVLDRVKETLQGLGKRPVIIEREQPGFVWNRLQLALLREALHIVESGVATPEVVDEIVRDGLARRWRHTGPFQTAALGGVDTFVRIADNLWPTLSAATEASSLPNHVPADDLDRLADRRDALLARELLEEHYARRLHASLRFLRSRALDNAKVDELS